jgi:hypothetical protein
LSVCYSDKQRKEYEEAKMVIEKLTTFLSVSCTGVRPGRPPAPDDYDVCGAVDGLIGKGNRSTRRKFISVPRCPPKITHMTQARTRVTVVESQRLTA